MSIIEVMTAIVVAMVGVFGVMVLIPFAVQQAQSGLNRDHATSVARNAMEAFDVQGFRNPRRWAAGVADDGSGLLVQTYTVPPTIPLCIDPVWVNANSGTAGPPIVAGSIGNFAGGTTANVQNNFGFWGEGSQSGAAQDFGVASHYPGFIPQTTNPFLGQVNPPLPPNLRIQRASLTDGVTVVDSMGDQLVRRLFQSSNELVFGEYVSPDIGVDAGLKYPAQIFDRDAAGNPLKRQSEERISWSLFVIPEPPGSGRYRMVTLVYVDRTPQLFTDPGTNSVVNNAAVMASAIIDKQPADVTYPSGLTTAGRELVLGAVDWGANQPPKPISSYVTVEGDSLVPGVNRDDWVMLTNFLPANYPEFGNPARQQIQFYRVVSVDVGDEANGVLASVSLDGAEFDFGPGFDSLGMPIPYPDNPTYIVHLRDVINVYEKQFSLEANSNWSFTSN